MNSVWKFYWNSVWITFPYFLMGHMVKALISWIQTTASVALPLHNLSQTPNLLYRHHLFPRFLSFLLTFMPTLFTGWFELFVLFCLCLCLAGAFSIKYRDFLASQKVHGCDDELRTIKLVWDEDAWPWVGFTPGKWLTTANDRHLSV